MIEPSRVPGFPGPRKPEESKESREIDPEKFKKVLKVDESDEAHKRKKRQLKKSEEDGDEEAVEQPQQQTVKNFAGLMEEGKKVGDSPFSVKTPQQTGVSSPYSQAHLSESEELPGLSGNEEPQIVGNHQELKQNPRPPPQQQTTGDLPPSQTRASSQEKTQQPQEAYARQKTEEGTAKKNISEASESNALAKSQAAAAKRKNSAGKSIKNEEKPSNIEEEKESYFQAYMDKSSKSDQKAQKKNKEIEEAIPSLAKPAPEQTASQNAIEEEKQERKKAAETSGVEGVQVQDQIPANPMVIDATSETPSLHRLPPDVYEFFEKTVGVLIIEQNKGITTTTITLTMPNSVLNGAQVILDHYSSAPNSFNLQLLGTPEAVNYFNQNIDDLLAAFQQSKLNFKVNIQTPGLLKDYRVVESTEEEEEGKERGT